MNTDQPTIKQNNVIYEAVKVHKPIIIDNTTYANNTIPKNNNQVYNIINNADIINYPNTEITYQKNIEYKDINNKDYLKVLNAGQQIKNNDIPDNNRKYETKTNTEKHIETYIIDPNTGKKIFLDNANDVPQEKYKNMTYIPDANIEEKISNEINLKAPKVLKGSKNKSQKEQVAETEELSPILENLDINATVTPVEEPINKDNNSHIKEKQQETTKISASVLSVSVLSDIKYKKYPQAKHSIAPLGNIAGFGVNSYNGKVKNYNEDRIKVVASHTAPSRRNPNYQFQVSYFAIFDGHAGKKCSDFLKSHFFEYLINSPLFPDEPIKAIRESFHKSEATFFQKAFDSKNKILLDKSGSCALIMLILNNILYSINLGDSRALYSYDTGRCLLQITRDHKPNDEIEKSRIEKAGGSVYYANKITRNGKEIELKEEQFGEGFTFPYRVSPGGLAVNNFLINNYYYLIIIGCKNYRRFLCENARIRWKKRFSQF